MKDKYGYCVYREWVEKVSVNETTVADFDRLFPSGTATCDEMYEASLTDDDAAHLLSFCMWRMDEMLFFKWFTDNIGAMMVAQHPSKYVRQALAKKHDDEMLCVDSLLCCDEDEHVRYNEAQNRNISIPACYMLAGDPASSVRAILAYNPVMPTDALMVLAEDEESNVRFAAASALSERKNAAKRKINTFGYPTTTHPKEDGA